MKTKLTLCCLSLLALAETGGAQTAMTGPSSSQSPYLMPATNGARIKSLLTVGDAAANGYQMVGIPDGTGAFDNGNGTFTVLMNHELNQTAGVIRKHGNMGAFVSKWVLNKTDLTVISGEDLIHTVHLWNTPMMMYQMHDSMSPMPIGFGRFCSADLAPISAFHDDSTGKGTMSRIFLNGEEVGTDGRAFAHIATGPNAGHTYELPRLGKFSWENAVANPATKHMTVVAGLDDATPGQVYFYVGAKTDTGNEISKAGLANGNLYGIAVQAMVTETSAGIPAPNTPFAMINLGNVENMSGTTLNNNSNALGVTTFLRPEDGAWDPRHPEDFYFVTTNSFTAPSRLWKLHFNNLMDMTQGGTITAVLDGTEGQKMMDNVGFDHHGNLVIQEDPGNQAYLARMWNYNVDTDVLTEILVHDSSRFMAGGANFLTVDEEASGVIDVSEILGNGWFLGVDQAHYAIPGELVEGGQFYAFLNPFTECAGLSDSLIASGPTNICTSDMLTLTASSASSYMWSNGDTMRSIMVSQSGSYSVTAYGSSGCMVQSDTINVTVSGPNAQIMAGGPTVICPKTSVQLMAATQASGTSYRWYRDGANAGSQQTINAKNAGLYMLIVKNGACSDTAYETVSVLPAPMAMVNNMGANTICQGDTAMLQASPMGFGYTYSWTRNQVLTNEFSDMANATMTGNYRVMVTDPNGCVGTSPAYFVKVETLPLASIGVIGNTTTIPMGGALTLRSTYNSSLSFQWYLNGNPITGATNRLFTTNIPGDYHVVVTRGNCSNMSVIANLTAASSMRQANTNAIMSTVSEDIAIAAYPNPVTSTMTITIDGGLSAAGSIEVLDLNGRVLAQQVVTASELTVDMSRFANGLYLVRYRDEAGHNAMLKISKQ